MLLDRALRGAALVRADVRPPRLAVHRSLADPRHVQACLHARARHQRRATTRASATTSGSSATGSSRSRASPARRSSRQRFGDEAALSPRADARVWPYCGCSWSRHVQRVQDQFHHYILRLSRRSRPSGHRARPRFPAVSRREGAPRRLSRRAGSRRAVPRRTASRASSRAASSATSAATSTVPSPGPRRRPARARWGSCSHSRRGHSRRPERP